MSNTFRAALRAAAVTLLQGYKAANNGALTQIYPGRPLSFYAPCAFVEAINEPDINYTAQMVQRTPRAEIRFVHGAFDSAEAVAQQDALVDGFLQYCIDNKHAAGAPTLVAVVAVQDEPGWVPEWLPDKSFYSTVVVLEGSALNAD
jgi:hypothetical protein